MSLKGTKLTLAFEGATTARSLRLTVWSRGLQPELERGTAGNSDGQLQSTHKYSRATELIEERDFRAALPAALLTRAQLVIEGASKIKGIIVRRAKARTPEEALAEATSTAILAIKAQELQAFFDRCRYSAAAQPL
jgi:hypothetical protein